MIKDFLTTNNLLLFKDRLLHNEFSMLRHYYELLQANSGGVKDKKHIDFSHIRVRGLIGFDDHNNSYWRARNELLKKTPDIIIVCSKKGEIIDVFINSLPIDIAVAPNGDVYGMECKDNGVNFYRIKRQWALDQPVEEELPAIAVIHKLLYSNYLEKYGIIFHPLKAFDGRPDTPWTEKSWGSGIGDYIGAEFEEAVTVDEIEILHGYFYGMYFSFHNRVKKLRIELDGKGYEKKFEDMMVPQKVIFDKQDTFKKIKRIIREVYRGSEYDDTAISDVRFYYKGKKIEIDVSHYAEFLK